jgi:uncharacterized protein YbjT (DUF2867 family)
MKVLVTGGTGTLGRPLVSAIASMGHQVRALSRNDRPDDGGVEWVRGDLRTGDGIARSVAGVDTVVHAATLSGYAGGKTRLRYMFMHPSHTDVEGTQGLVEAARDAGVAHFVYVSIVGVDRVPVGYWKHKVQAEEIVRRSGLPYTLARATQFHELIDAGVRYALRFPVALLPRDQRVQPIDSGDAARAIGALLGHPAMNGIVDFGGPERTTMGEAADAWLAHRGVSRTIRRMPIPGRLGKELAAGALCTDDRSGEITWKQWLDAHPKEAS